MLLSLFGIAKHDDWYFRKIYGNQTLHFITLYAHYNKSQTDLLYFFD